jgi:hypothetical protein
MHAADFAYLASQPAAGGLPDAMVLAGYIRGRYAEESGHLLADDQVAGVAAKQRRDGYSVSRSVCRQQSSLSLENEAPRLGSRVSERWSQRQSLLTPVCF